MEHELACVSVNFVTSIASFNRRYGRYTAARRRWTNPSMEIAAALSATTSTLWSILRLRAFPVANYFGFAPKSALVRYAGMLKACKRDSLCSRSFVSEARREMLLRKEVRHRGETIAERKQPGRNWNDSVSIDPGILSIGGT